jgi:cobalt-precorrin-5B (C1)-methyltransferase
MRAIRRLKADHPGEYHLTVLVCDFEGQAICRVEEGQSSPP